jgi:hypothetical protein
MPDRVLLVLGHFIFQRKGTSEMPSHAMSRAAERLASTTAINDGPFPTPETIPVTNGPDALCDQNDFAFLSRFTWWVKQGNNVAWVVTRIGGQMLYMHHLVLLNSERCKVNHRDGNGFNNCRNNLRAASCGQVEAAKVKSTKRTYTSQYKGVCKPQGKILWQAGLRVAGVSRRLGTFENEDDAARAYDAAALEAFGEFAYQNFPR